MAETAEFAAEIAGDGADIGAFAAFSFEVGAIRRNNRDEFQPINLHGARRELDRLTVAGEIIGALARDFECREPWRGLHDGASEGRERGADFGCAGTAVACLDDSAFRVIRVTLLAPLYGEAIELLAVHYRRHGLGGLHERVEQ